MNDDLYINALELGRANGFKVKTLPDRIGPLNDKQAEYIGIKDLRKQLEYQVGRPVEFMLYDNVQGVLLRGNSHIVK
nr:hypothetical protein [Acinetobacter sp. Marseille-Q1620]